MGDERGLRRLSARPPSRLHSPHVRRRSPRRQTSSSAIPLPCDALNHDRPPSPQPSPRGRGGATAPGSLLPPGEGGPKGRMRVRLFHVKHLTSFYFPTHNRAKISPSTSSTPIRPTIRSIAAAARRRSSAISSGAAAPGSSAASERLARVLKSAPVPLKRQQGRLVRRHALFREIRKDVKQPIDPGARFRRYGESRRDRAGRARLGEVDLGPDRQGRASHVRRLARRRRRSATASGRRSSALRRALATPSCSIGSALSRMPAVSTRMTG